MDENSFKIAKMIIAAWNRCKMLQQKTEKNMSKQRFYL